MDARQHLGETGGRRTQPVPRGRAQRQADTGRQGCLEEVFRLDQQVERGIAQGQHGLGRHNERLHVDRHAKALAGTEVFRPALCRGRDGAPGTADEHLFLDITDRLHRQRVDGHQAHLLDALHRAGRQRRAVQLPQRGRGLGQGSVRAFGGKPCQAFQAFSGVLHDQVPGEDAAAGHDQSDTQRAGEDAGPDDSSATHVGHLEGNGESLQAFFPSDHELRMRNPVTTCRKMTTRKPPPCPRVESRPEG